MKEILIILLCVPLYVINSFCDKHVSRRAGSGYAYNAVKFGVGTLCFMPLVLLEGFRWEAGAFICGVLCGLMYAVSKTVILTGYEKTSVAFMTFCHSAGMIVPCAWGHFFWNEKLTAAALVGIGLTVFSAVLLKEGSAGRKKHSALGLWIGLAVFLVSGGVMMCQKVMGLSFPGQSVSAYNWYSFLAPCLLIGLLAGKQPGGFGKVRRVWPFAAASAVSLCVISFVMTSLAGRVPSVILFPLFNGLGIVIVCVGSVFAFKEKMTLRKAIGIAAGLVGLCLINI